MERKLIQSIREVLAKAGFENLKSTRSRHRLALGGNKGRVRVLVQFSDGLEQPAGSEFNPKVPRPGQIALKPNLKLAGPSGPASAGSGAAGQTATFLRKPSPR